MNLKLQKIFEQSVCVSVCVGVTVHAHVCFIPLVFERVNKTFSFSLIVLCLSLSVLFRFFVICFFQLFCDF